MIDHSHVCQGATADEKKRRCKVGFAGLMTKNGSTNGFSTTTLLWRRQSNFQTKVQRKGHISSSIRQRSVGYNVTYNFFVSVEPKGFSVHEKISISAKSIWYSVSLRRDWICCLTRHENSKGSSILHTPPQLFFQMSYIDHQSRK